MKNVLVLDASMRKGYTGALAQEAAKRLSASYNVETVCLRDENIETCKGCCLCLSEGSGRCPLREDGARAILQKMTAAQGIVFLVPNYSLQIPGKLKTLLDRLAYVFHRPRLFHKVFMPLTVQGVYGGKDINKYLNKVFRFWGAITVKGTVLPGGIYLKDIGEKLFTAKNTGKLDKALREFDREMAAVKPKKPSLFQVTVFRSTRSAMRYFDDTLKPDKEYYRKNGWYEAAYYYPVRLNLLKKTVGYLIDRQMKAAAKKAKANQKAAAS